MKSTSWSSLLFYAIPRRDTNPIAHRLLDRFGSLSAVLEAEPALLTEVDGISEHSALLIKLVAALAYDYINSARSAAEQIRFADLDELGKYVASQFIGLNRETVMAFSLDASCRITGRKILFCGCFRDAKVSRSRSEPVRHRLGRRICGACAQPSERHACPVKYRPFNDAAAVSRAAGHRHPSERAFYYRRRQIYAHDVQQLKLQRLRAYPV